MTNPAQSTPVVVAPDANADEMNKLHGEAYGVDWVYPSMEAMEQNVGLSRPTSVPAQG